MKKTLIFLLLIGIAALGFAQAISESFENGTALWNLSGGVALSTANSHTGLYSMYYLPSVIQSITTVQLGSPGALSFWAVQGSGGNNIIEVYVSSDGINWGTPQISKNISAIWTQYFFTFTQTNVYIKFQNTANSNRATYLDDILISPSTLIPVQYRSKHSGNWGDASTWEYTAAGGVWLNATVPPTDVNSFAITIQSGHTVTVTANRTADQLVVNSGGTLTVNNGVTLTLADGTGTDLNVNGTLNVLGTGVVSGAGSFVLNADAALGIGSPAGITSSGATGSIQTAGRSYNTASSYTYLGTSAQVTGNGLPATVKNLTINNSAGVTMSGSYSVYGDLALTTNLTIAANTLSIDGTVSGSGGLTGGSSSNVTVNGTTALVLPAVTSGLQNLVINRSGGVSLGGTTAVNGTLTTTSGMLSLANFNLTAANVTGNVNIGYNGTGYTTSTLGNAANITVSVITPGTIPSIVNSLIINSGAGNTVTQPNDITTTNLTFTSGNLNLNNRKLTLANKDFALKSTNAVLSALSVTMTTAVNNWTGFTSIAKTWQTSDTNTNTLDVLLSYPTTETGANLVRVWKRDTVGPGAWTLVGYYEPVTVGTNRVVTVTGQTTLNGTGGGLDWTITDAIPRIQATAVNFSNVQLYQVTVNWTRGDGANCVVFLKETTEGTPGNPSNGTTYTASTNWSAKGTQLGATGYYCIYNGTGTSVTVTNLLSSTNYYAIVYEYNGTGTASDYMPNGAVGNTTTLTHTITLSSYDPAVGASNVAPGTSNVVLYRYTLTSTNAAATLTKFVFSTAGTYTTADITNLKLWYSATDDFASATLISTLTTGLGTGSHTFTGFNQTIGMNTTGYFFITTDVTALAGVNHTINVNAIATGDLSFNSGNVTGTAYIGGLKTITFKTRPDDYFRTIATGDWNNISIWESSHDGGITWYPATNYPTAPSTVYLNNNVNMTSAAEACTNLTFNSGGSVTLGNYNLSISGTLSGTPYYYYTGSGVPSQTGTVSHVTATTTTPSSIPSILNTLTINPGVGNTVVIPNLLTTTNLDFISGSLNFNNHMITLANKDFALSSTNSVMSALTVTLTNDVNTWNTSTSIAHTWTTSGSFTNNVDMHLSYPATETATSTVKLWYRDSTSGVWTYYGSYTPSENGGIETITVPGVTDLGSSGSPRYWTISDNDQTLPVELSSFTGFITPQNYILLQWVTQSETSVSGYYIFRSYANSLNIAERINAFIPATNTSQEASYVFVDSEALPGYTWYYWLQHIEMNGESEFHGPVSVHLINGSTILPTIPLATSLQQIYPNPFNPQTTISYGLAKASNLELIIMNGKGQVVRHLYSGQKNAGNYMIRWDGLNDNGSAVTSGVYYIRMVAEKFSSVRKLVLMK